MRRAKRITPVDVNEEGLMNGVQGVVVNERIGRDMENLIDENRENQGGGE